MIGLEVSNMRPMRDLVVAEHTVVVVLEVVLGFQEQVATRVSQGVRALVGEPLCAQ